MTLRDVFHQPSEELHGLWLYLPGKPEEWALETDAFLFDANTLDRDPETDIPIFTPELAPKKLCETLEGGAVSDCVQWADRLNGSPNDPVRLESFLYYYRFDAFMPQIGAPDPPPWEETQRRLDLEFYESLGPEDPAHLCRRESCGRGVIQHSVLCKRHHFEMVERRSCPF
jgi:hypothetical protein